MRCLLIGASGFLGGQVRARLAADPAVTVIAAGRSGPLRLDLDDAGLTARLRDLAPDVVVNCAGAIDGSPASLARGNVVAVARLVTAAAAIGCRLVHLGSAAEYGVVPDGRSVGETFTPQPVSAYGMSKLAGTELVLAARRDGLTATVLRVFNPIGPGTPSTLLPGRLVAALRDPAIRLGPLDGHRDFVDVRDVAAAVEVACWVTGALPGVVNIGSGRAAALRDLAALAAGMTGVPQPIEETIGSARSAAVTWQQADITLARSVLGFRPEYSLSDSVRSLVAA
ncbi:NAD(P)-dependent oxidoreductase [Actinoplanes sp. NPDC089786]|uniref:NAD-dependent epimerase/dehydratase family protein n=1 Tax=Actinoplanes sp. NPDC089786 TaxID=3155185 RepID=UPI00344501ED